MKFITISTGIAILLTIAFSFVSCEKENTSTESDLEYMERKRNVISVALDCIITPTDNPITLNQGDQITLTGSPGSFNGAVTYSWSVSNTSCINIIGSNTGSTVVIEATSDDCNAVVSLMINQVGGPLSSHCTTIVDVLENTGGGWSGPCNFDFWAVPKWYPVCFGDCTGNLDHVVEIHHSLPSGVQLPNGFTTWIHDVQLTGNTTFGNCFDCQNPILNLPNNQSSTSFNMAICGPLNHSMLIDIAIRDAQGNIVAICEDNYFSIFVPACN